MSKKTTKKTKRQGWLQGGKPDFGGEWHPMAKYFKPEDEFPPAKNSGFKQDNARRKYSPNRFSQSEYGKNLNNIPNAQNISQYLERKGLISNDNVAVPFPSEKLLAKVNPELQRYRRNSGGGRLLLQHGVSSLATGRKAVGIPRGRRGGPGLMSITGPALAAGLGSLTRMIRDNNTKEMGKRR